MARQVRSFPGRCLIGFVALLVAGCATTKLVDQWKDESYAKLPIQKVLVVISAENERSRRTAEDSFVRAFRAANVEAVAGYTLLPGELKIDKETIAQAIEGKGFDVVLVAGHEETETTSVYVPGEVRTEVVGSPYYGGHRSWDRYDHREYRTIEQPGYYSEQKVVYLETSLYETRGGQLIWSARSESQNPESVSDIVDPLAKVIIKQFTDDGFL